MYSALASAYAVASLQTFSKLSHSFRSCRGAFCALESFVLMVFVILDPAVVELTRAEIASAPPASIRRQISRQEALSPAAFAHQSTLTVDSILRQSELNAFDQINLIFQFGCRARLTAASTDMYTTPTHVRASANPSQKQTRSAELRSQDKQQQLRSK